MTRFETGKALHTEATELERQQKEMLAKTKEKEKEMQSNTIQQEEIKPEIVLVEPQNTERITLRLPKSIHDSMKLIGRFEDKSLNAMITKACLELIGKAENQEKIKKYNKFK